MGGRRVSKGMLISVIFSVGLFGWLHLRARGQDADLQLQISQLRKAAAGAESFQNSVQSELSAIKTSIGEIESTLDEVTNTVADVRKSRVDADTGLEHELQQVRAARAADNENVERMKTKVAALSRRAAQQQVKPAHVLSVVEPEQAAAVHQPDLKAAVHAPPPKAAAVHQPDLKAAVHDPKGRLEAAASSLAVLLFMWPDGDVSGSYISINEAIAASKLPTVFYIAAATHQPLGNFEHLSLTVLQIDHHAVPLGPLDSTPDPATGILGGNFRQAMNIVAERGHQKVVVLRNGCTLAVDALDFFSSSLSFVQHDDSLWAVMGLNHNGHTVGDPQRLFRTEFFLPTVYALNTADWMQMQQKSWWHNSTAPDWSAWLRGARQGRAALAPESTRAECSNWLPRGRLPPMKLTTQFYQLFKPAPKAEYDQYLFMQLQGGRVLREPYSSRTQFEAVASKLGLDTQSVGGAPSMGYMGFVVAERDGTHPKTFIHPSGVENLESLFNQWSFVPTDGGVPG